MQERPAEIPIIPNIVKREDGLDGIDAPFAENYNANGSSSNRGDSKNRKDHPTEGSGAIKRPRARDLPVVMAEVPVLERNRLTTRKMEQLNQPKVFLFFIIITTIFSTASNHPLNNFVIGATTAERSEGTLNSFTNKTFSAKYRKLLAGRRKLPVNEHRKESLDLIQNIQVVNLVGETGSRKTTLFIAPRKLATLEETEHACRKIKHRADQMPDSAFFQGLTTVPDIDPQAQKKIYEDAPPPMTPGRRIDRKIVVSTKIAEPSLAIDGINYVIGPWFSKQESIPSKCLRLYTESDFVNELIETTYLEILRSNLRTVLLQLKNLRIDDLAHFDFMDPPTLETLVRAWSY
ncbi:hypothetical protein BGZ65_001459 [Modicella reniformis]|uniref:RNA helicase n=1 Tax=Modicella reniformis TaxID=1440133 RepID=A0A9P6SPP6_9FUNG|nr:hypothetical protein BGZ65_001459 [Modicella reniformis]